MCVEILNACITASTELVDHHPTRSTRKVTVETKDSAPHPPPMNKSQAEVTPKGLKVRRKVQKNLENARMSRTPIGKKWLETKKGKNSKFTITKCVKYTEPTISTSEKRRTLSKSQKIQKIQKEKFVEFFKLAKPKPLLPTPQPLVPRPDRSRHSPVSESLIKNITNKENIHDTKKVNFKPGKIGDLRKKFELLSKKSKDPISLSRNVVAKYC